MRCTASVDDGLILGNAFNVTVTPQNSETRNTFLDYRAGLEYDLTRDSLLYATVSTAHKAAGYNDTVYRPDGLSLFGEYYDPEDVTAFELGRIEVIRLLQRMNGQEVGLPGLCERRRAIQRPVAAGTQVCRKKNPAWRPLCPARLCHDRLLCV